MGVTRFADVIHLGQAELEASDLEKK